VHVSKKTGKSIPLDPQTKQPHQCDADPLAQVQAQTQEQEAAAVATTDTLKFEETLSSLHQDYIRLKHAEAAARRSF
jgi:hypothetical protein